MFKLKSVLAGVLAGLAGLLMVGAAQPAPLEPAACDQVSAEAAKLEAGDAAGQILKGPAWAHDHLSASQLADIARLLDLRETLEFRCGRPGAAVQAALKAQPVDQDAEASAEVPKPKVKAAQKPKPNSKPVAAEVSTADTALATPRSKVKDAYQPPPAKPVVAGGSAPDTH